MKSSKKLAKEIIVGGEKVEIGPESVRTEKGKSSDGLLKALREAVKKGTFPPPQSDATER